MDSLTRSGLENPISLLLRHRGTEECSSLLEPRSWIYEMVSKNPDPRIDFEDLGKNNPLRKPSSPIALQNFNLHSYSPTFKLGRPHWHKSI